MGSFGKGDIQMLKNSCFVLRMYNLTFSSVPNSEIIINIIVLFQLELKATFTNMLCSVKLKLEANVRDRDMRKSECLNIVKIAIDLKL